jgi:hypothetical protein
MMRFTPPGKIPSHSRMLLTSSASYNPKQGSGSVVGQQTNSRAHRVGALDLDLASHHASLLQNTQGSSQATQNVYMEKWRFGVHEQRLICDARWPSQAHVTARKGQNTQALATADNGSHKLENFSVAYDQTMHLQAMRTHFTRVWRCRVLGRQDRVTLAAMRSTRENVVTGMTGKRANALQHLHQQHHCDSRPASCIFSDG